MPQTDTPPDGSRRHRLERLLRAFVTECESRDGTTFAVGLDLGMHGPTTLVGIEDPAVHRNASDS